jgi:hypothetical protein
MSVRDEITVHARQREKFAEQFGVPCTEVMDRAPLFITRKTQAASDTNKRAQSRPRVTASTVDNG